MIDDDHLQISLSIQFGSQNRTKLWSLKIKLFHLPFKNNQATEEISLDPKDWGEIRSFGHRIMDDMMDYSRDIRLRPPWRPIPPEIKKAIANCDIPWEGQSLEQVYDEICSFTLPYVVGNIHPLFWGYAQGAGSPVGALAEFITATLNTMSWGGQQASIYLERQVLSWLKELMGFPNDETSSGVLVSGTSVATIIAVAVARKKFQNRNMMVYCSIDAHSCIVRALDLLGIKRENLILIPINEQRQIDLKVTYDLNSEHLHRKKRNSTLLQSPSAPECEDWRIAVSLLMHRHILLRLWKHQSTRIHVVLSSAPQVQ